ncbi:helix-turn-helix domain-containing protein [Flavobacterium sp. DG1-102-2]|uniref:winged helix-turn-helix transcriptional regulator n=1 Tax=Flavobacterium sp. DG1-102-2 TaxID=3081663 RepID=UPI00294A430F|nr:helix-turn-helix domain-containing protein [Flavobacterium sp. DG1-102-2]MDV6169426.1 helix-turn-helix domain-containing protein [Flavobacterium sp. DG1-102-2]
MEKDQNNDNGCPAEGLLKQLSGKWKPQIFLSAVDGPVRFNALLRDLKGSNKQSVATALRELHESGLLEKETIQLKPLHIEYTLSEKGKSLVPVFRQLELFSAG